MKQEQTEHGSGFVVGQTVYVNGCELIVTQVRIDRTASGTAAMILLADPILYTKERMEYESRQECIKKHKASLDAMTKNLSTDGPPL